MIKNKSKQTYTLLEQKVLMDITKKGWIGIPTPPETPYEIYWNDWQDPKGFHIYDT